MPRLALCLAALLVALTAGSIPSVAFPAFADYCNSYAADKAAGRKGGAYDVGAERRYMEAYKFCMKAHDTPLAIMFMKFGDEAIAHYAAEHATEVAVVEVTTTRHSYCKAKYRSYNPSTGLYRTYSGKLKHCP